MFNKNRGFTLIELLVVIAIIGILASVVLASLNTARSKGGDAAVKANLSSIRPQAELAYDDNNNSYGTAQALGLCPTGAANSLVATTTIIDQIAAATSAGSGLNACQNSGTAYAVVVQLKTDTLKGFCVDSTGKAKEVDLATADQAGLSAEISGSACVE